MSARVVGAILAFAAAAAFVLAIFSGAWWDGHPAVSGATIARKDVHIGILGAHGCNRGETYECSELPLDDIVPALLVTAFLAATAGALFSIAVGVTLLRREERRKLIAKIALGIAIGCGVLALVLVVLGPGLKAEHVTVPIGYGTIVFALGAALSIAGSVLARRELPFVRPEVAVTEPPDALAFLREEVERPQPGGSLPGYSGTLGAPSVEGAPLFAAAPQLRPLYEMDGGSAPTAAAPPRFPQRAPTPIPRANISAAVGIPTPPPFTAAKPPTLPPFSATGPTPPAFPAAQSSSKPPTMPPAFAAAAKPTTTPPAFSVANPSTVQGFVAKPPTTSPGLAAKPAPGFTAKPPTTSPGLAAKPTTTSPGMPAAVPAIDKPAAKVPLPARIAPPSRPTPTPTPHTPPPHTPAPTRAETDAAERAATLAREDRTSENPVVEEVGDATSPNVEPVTAVETALTVDDGEEAPTARQSSSDLKTLLREKVRLSDLTISTTADTALAEVVPRPETVTGVEVVKVVSTAPDSLPPPEDQPQASGPSPACPQCEAPMRWVEEHLRFYCKSCRMYF